MKAIGLTLACWLALALPAAAAGGKAAVRLIVLGDSLSAGYQLAESEALPARLQQYLIDGGHNVEILNAGVSGDTSSGGLARLEWSVPKEADGVIVELGANDALRALDPSVTRAALDQIVTKLLARGQKVLLIGMLAPPNLGTTYGDAFNRIYPDLAAKHGVMLYPFIMDGIITDPKLLLQDQLHPNAEGVRQLAKRLLPTVEQFVATIEQGR